MFFRCQEYKDDEGKMLIFAVKKGSDTTIFWKVTVRIACVKMDYVTKMVVSHRLLNIRQFLQVKNDLVNFTYFLL